MRIVETQRDNRLVMAAFGLLQRHLQQAHELHYTLNRVTAQLPCSVVVSRVGRHLLAMHRLQVIVLDSRQSLARAQDVYQLKFELRYLIELELTSTSEQDLDLDSLRKKAPHILVSLLHLFFVAHSAGLR